MEKAEKISVSDLSVGDWVYVQFTDGDKWSGRIVSSSDTGEMEVLCSDTKVVRCTIHFIFPIPITAEVLEKNGLHEAEFGLAVKPKSNELCASMGISIKIKYIHELQHILRLAKTDKEIVL